MKDRKVTEVRSKCVVCRTDSRMTSVFDWKGIPITGLYKKASEPFEDPRNYQVDNELLLCQDCGQLQLLNVVDTNFLYGEKYWYRTSTSTTARDGIDFFDRYLRSVTGDRPFKRVLEVGCNDLYWLSKTKDRAERLLGVDPIWKGQPKPDFANVSVIGDYVQNVDVAGALGGKPDLIVSEHTFEHIPNPFEVFASLVEIAADDAYFFVELPSFEMLYENYRFDQVFHQHLNYFSVPSLKRMIQKLGCEYVGHTFNVLYWGAIIIAFKKGKGRIEPSEKIHSPSDIQQRYRHFKSFMSAQSESLVDLHRAGQRVVGFGAAQMAPSLAYHMGTDLGFLDCIYDDDERKVGMSYVNLPARFKKPDETTDLRSSTALVLGVDFMRGILPRVLSFNPQRVKIPMVFL